MSGTSATAVSPRAIASGLLDELLDQLPGVRDGNPESVHGARVATRRLREVLPLVFTGQQERLEAATKVIRRAGRRLGRVRELDVMSDQLGRVEERFPDSAVAVAVARRNLADLVKGERRGLVKLLDRLRLDRVGKIALAPPGVFARIRHPMRAVSGWNAQLRNRIGDRARELSTAIEHAAGLYFPNRLHATRIAAKKLRYSVELADRLDLWRPPRLLRDLRRVQATLGDLHDAQVLVDRLAELVPADVAAGRGRALLEGAVRADIVMYHEEYLAKRDRLRAIWKACARFAANESPQRRRTSRSLAAASALAVPAGLLMAAGGRPRKPREIPAPAGLQSAPPGRLARPAS